MYMYECIRISIDVYIHTSIHTYIHTKMQPTQTTQTMNSNAYVCKTKILPPSTYVRKPSIQTHARMQKVVTRKAHTSMHGPPPIYRPPPPPTNHIPASALRKFHPDLVRPHEPLGMHFPHRLAVFELDLRTS